MVLKTDAFLFLVYIFSRVITKKNRFFCLESTIIFIKKSDDEEKFLFIINSIKGFMGAHAVHRFLIAEASELFLM